MIFFLNSFGWKKIAYYVTITQAALLIKLLHGIFKIANMAKILYENIKRKLTIVSYLFLALTIPNLVVLTILYDPNIVISFIYYLFSATILSSQKLKNTKYRFWLQKVVKNSIWYDFLNRDPKIVGGFIYYFFSTTIL